MLAARRPQRAIELPLTVARAATSEYAGYTVTALLKGEQRWMTQPLREKDAASVVLSVPPGSKATQFVVAAMRADGDGDATITYEIEVASIGVDGGVGATLVPWRDCGEGDGEGEVIDVNVDDGVRAFVLSARWRGLQKIIKKSKRRRGVKSVVFRKRSAGIAVFKVVGFLAESSSTVSASVIDACVKAASLETTSASLRLVGARHFAPIPLLPGLEIRARVTKRNGLEALAFDYGSNIGDNPFEMVANAGVIALDPLEEAEGEQRRVASALAALTQRVDTSAAADAESSAQRVVVWRHGTGLTLAPDEIVAKAHDAASVMIVSKVRLSPFVYFYSFVCSLFFCLPSILLFAYFDRLEGRSDVLRRLSPGLFPDRKSPARSPDVDAAA